MNVSDMILNLKLFQAKDFPDLVEDAVNVVWKSEILLLDHATKKFIIEHSEQRHATGSCAHAKLHCHQPAIALPIHLPEGKCTRTSPPPFPEPLTAIPNQLLFPTNSRTADSLVLHSPIPSRIAETIP